MNLRFTKPGLGTLLSPADEQTAEVIKQLKIGEIIHGDYKKQRKSVSTWTFEYLKSI